MIYYCSAEAIRCPGCCEYDFFIGHHHLNPKMKAIQCEVMINDSPNSYGNAVRYQCSSCGALTIVALAEETLEHNPEQLRDMEIENGCHVNFCYFCKKWSITIGTLALVYRIPYVKSHIF